MEKLGVRLMEFSAAYTKEQIELGDFEFVKIAFFRKVLGAIAGQVDQDDAIVFVGISANRLIGFDTDGSRFLAQNLIDQRRLPGAGLAEQGHLNFHFLLLIQLFSDGLRYFIDTHRTSRSVVGTN
nr:hypothetical protein [uncultured Duganella sp.]